MELVYMWVLKTHAYGIEGSNPSQCTYKYFIMDNNITISPTEIRKLPNNSITDPEIIRQIAMLGEKDLFDKVKEEFEFCGLYPFVMNRFDILPDKLKCHEKS